MLYNNETKKWEPSGGSQGVSKIQVYHHPVNNTYRIVGRKIVNHDVSVIRDRNWIFFFTRHPDQKSPQFTSPSHFLPKLNSIFDFYYSTNHYFLTYFFAPPVTMFFCFLWNLQVRDTSYSINSDVPTICKKLILGRTEHKLQ